MKYSLTQFGNVGQMISFFLVVIGFSTPEEAGAVTDSILVTVGVIVHLSSWIASWIGRYRIGDVDIFGWKK